MKRGVEWRIALRGRALAASPASGAMILPSQAVEAAVGPGMTGGVADELVLSVERDPATGMWRVEADDGSILEADFRTAASASRWMADHSDLSDQDARSVVMRASPRQRRELRRLLDEIEGVGAYGSA